MHTSFFHNVNFPELFEVLSFVPLFNLLALITFLKTMNNIDNCRYTRLFLALMSLALVLFLCAICT